MRYDHLLKHNGTYYKAGADVPTGVELVDDVPDGALKTNPDGSVPAFDRNGNQVGTVDAETVKKLQEPAGNGYRKSDITRMGVENLRKLATELGLEKAEESTGEALKAAIIDKLGL